VEKRQFTRVLFKARVAVNVDGVETCGETENISLRGMYIQGFQTLPLDQEVQVEISVPDSPEDRHLKTKAVPVRYCDGGTGFQFGAMDFDSFFALQEIVTKVSGTPGQVMSEVMRFINGT
jgi:hypothetical protein